MRNWFTRWIKYKPAKLGFCISHIEREQRETESSWEATEEKTLNYFFFFFPFFSSLVLQSDLELWIISFWFLGFQTHLQIPLFSSYSGLDFAHLQSVGFQLLSSFGVLFFLVFLLYYGSFVCVYLSSVMGFLSCWLYCLGLLSKSTMGFLYLLLLGFVAFLCFMACFGCISCFCVGMIQIYI